MMNHQSNTIDALLTKAGKQVDEIETLQDELKEAQEQIVDLKIGLKRLRKKNQKLKEEVFRENQSHNYHCKESQRKNDVIDEKNQVIDKWFKKSLAQGKEILELKEKK